MEQIVIFLWFIKLEALLTTSVGISSKYVLPYETLNSAIKLVLPLRTGKYWFCFCPVNITKHNYIFTSNIINSLIILRRFRYRNKEGRLKYCRFQFHLCNIKTILEKHFFTKHNLQHTLLYSYKHQRKNQILV